MGENEFGGRRKKGRWREGKEVEMEVRGWEK